jgi:hypothetical protein
MSIEKILSKKVSFYKQLSKKQKDELWDLLSDYQKYSIFLKHQKKVGFGKDKITIVEYGVNDDLSKFKNLKKWDKANYKYQLKHGQTNLDTKYKLYLFGDWCRLIENKKLIYGEIFSLHGYIFDKIIDRLYKFEAALYPHKSKFKFIKNSDKKTSTLQTTTKAYGKEKELEQFSSFRMKFTQEILYPEIKKYILNNFPSKTYRIINKKETFDNFHQFLFSDNIALRNCKFDTFLEDFNRLKGDVRDLKLIEKKFYNYSTKYLMKNFDHK